MKNISVKTNAAGANGVFSYGGSAITNNSSSDGTAITISDSIITTLKDNSGGHNDNWWKKHECVQFNY